MNISVNQVYTSVACNRITEIIDWNREGQICFGASNAVVVYDTNAKGVDPMTVLSHHRNRVNSVKWLKKNDGSSTEFISCSADKTAAVWALQEEKWVVTGTMAGHGAAVTCIHGIYTNDEDVEVYTGCIDTYVRVWKRLNGVLSLKQSINLHSGLCLTLHAHVFTTVKKPMLFCALDDHKIHIFAGDDEYQRVQVLMGHEDWVRGMDVLDVDNNTVMLASASHDTYIRLWRIQQHREQPQGYDIRVQEKLYQAYGAVWSVKLEAVLAGHEGWVQGVQWYPRHFYGGDEPVYRLLSSSLDKTLIIWEPNQDGVWVEKLLVGEVGGNGLGFYGGRFGPGDRFVGHGYNGSFHMWALDNVSKQWRAAAACGGHFGPVEDVRWERGGRYLLSAALDQTARVHAPWRRDPESSEWHEVARPQVHGYDMAALALVSATEYASAAEEKVVRVFRAPHSFLSSFRHITGERLADDELGGPEGAAVPSLGLSNKAVFGHDVDSDDNGWIELHEPPTEETLMQQTLWPERHKLYGHGYEVFALDASADGALLASACKATSAEHAAVIIWETSTWQQIQKLPAHKLTVTQLAFSPDSRRLLSVSRDRRWALHRREEGAGTFHMAASSDKSNGVHTRIVWCCAWSHDGAVFATGSRDGKVCIWTKTESTSDSSLKDYGLVGNHLEVPNASVTALAFAPVIVNGSRVVAVGLDSGIIRIYGFGDEWSQLYELDRSTAHHLTVKRLSFRPTLPQGEGGGERAAGVMLASGGADHFVRLYNINVA